MSNGTVINIDMPPEEFNELVETLQVQLEEHGWRSIPEGSIGQIQAVLHSGRESEEAKDFLQNYNELRSS